MAGSIQVYGEFHLSSSLARRVQRAVAEFVQQDTLSDLSHVDENCALCKPRFVVPGLRPAVPAGAAAAQAGFAPASKEVDRDASEPDRSGRQWVA